MVSDSPATRVDIHCHTFNGADLPVEGFVRRVVLRDKDWPGWVKARLARWADGLVQSPGLGYEPERSILQMMLDHPRRDLLLSAEEQVADERFNLQVEQDEAALAAHDPATAAYLGLAPRQVRRLDRGETSAFVKFARNLASSRLDVARRLVATYPSVDVFTPMLVDMAYGVGDKPLTTVAEQIDLHEKISSLSIMGRLTQRSALLLPFVGFDPRREQHAPGALGLVQDAVMHRGFAGVKMYPPMGFSPLGNDEPEIDGILDDLYSWCETEDVPITVHCNKTQGASNASNDERSDPAVWATVLDKHPGLHLNLGHFGGVRRTANKPFWPTEIARLARFDHLYADLGCHTDLLQPPGPNAYAEMLRGVLTGAGAAMRDRLMYGSDWSMLLEHPGCEGYVEAVSAAFPEGEHDRLLGGRALDFLGLGTVLNENGHRLRDRITALGADPATWFAPRR
ncbi:amidohydrolase family protein [Nocardioides sp. MH1]|uniref:amidohydrolase family protein n=1 Tax=Nocardioides sp. MH1 TaxID=3242490 RepID=UPI00352029EE